MPDTKKPGAKPGKDHYNYKGGRRRVNLSLDPALVDKFHASGKGKLSPVVNEFLEKLLSE